MVLGSPAAEQVVIPAWKHALQAGLVFISDHGVSSVEWKFLPGFGARGLFEDFLDLKSDTKIGGVCLTSEPRAPQECHYRPYILERHYGIALNARVRLLSAGRVSMNCPLNW